MKKVAGIGIVILGLLSSHSLQAGDKARFFAQQRKEREKKAAENLKKETEAAKLAQEQSDADIDQKKEILPPSLKGVGVPVSPHQKNNPKILNPQKQGPVKSETSHGHLIVIPRASDSSTP